MNDLWIEGEPEKSGYYLVLVRTQGHPRGNPWFFLARVIVDDRDVPASELLNHGRPVYMNHHGGDDKWRAYMGGFVVGYCEPTADNFMRALEQTKDFYEQLERDQPR